MTNDQPMSEDFAVDTKNLPERFRSAAYPPLPTVGRIVHFYHREWEVQHEGRKLRTGPFAAIVTLVEVQKESDEEIIALVDLSVFTNNHHHPVQLFFDVPGAVIGAAHDYRYWWQWPTKGG